MKIVLDANVLIAAFASRGLCEAVFELCLEKHEIWVSDPLLAEVEDKLVSKIHLPRETAEEILEFLQGHTSRVEPIDVPSDACPDPADLMVLGTAKAAAADYLVTGDRDLLTLDAYEGIPILTPRRFWDVQSQPADDR